MSKIATVTLIQRRLARVCTGIVMSNRDLSPSVARAEGPRKLLKSTSSYRNRAELTKFKYTIVRNASSTR
jgi:hypothetical protein